MKLPTRKLNTYCCPHVPQATIKNSTKNSSQKYKFSLSTFGTVVAIAAPVAFLVSCIYDYSYYYAVGASIGTIPTTIADHVKSFIFWLPFAFLAAGDLALLRVKDELKFKDVSQISKNYLFIISVMIWFFFLIWMIIIVDALLASVVLYFTILCLVAFYFVTKYTEFFRKNIALSLFVIFVLFSGIPITVGILQARSSITTDASSIEFKDELGINADAIKPVRLIEKGALCFYEERMEIVFVPWEYIKEVNIKGGPRFSHGLICKWLGRCMKEYENNKRKIQSP